MTEHLPFYATHSPMTDPGEYASLYDDLQDDLHELFQVIHNVLIHYYEADDRYQPTSIQRSERFKPDTTSPQPIFILDPSHGMRGVWGEGK